MALRAIKPEVIKVGKPKMLISGESGAGKSMFALSFPKPYFIDSESGATRPQYRKKLEEAGGLYMGKDQGASDFATVINEVKTLATTKHDYRTLVIDSVSYLHLFAAAKAEETLGSDYGRDKKEANKPSRQLISWIEKTDMNIILISHSKTKWERTGSDNKKLEYAGTTFDFYDKTEYLLDLWIEIEEGAKGDRYFMVKKSRIDQFPKGKMFPLNYASFAELYGKDIIEKEGTQIKLASLEQVDKVKKLLDVVKITKEEIEAWFVKADASDWSDMTDDQIAKVITFLEKKLNTLKEAA